MNENTPQPPKQRRMTPIVLYILAVLCLATSFYYVDSTLDAGGVYNKTIELWANIVGVTLLALSIASRWLRVRFTTMDGSRKLIIERIPKQEEKRRWWNLIGLVLLYSIGVLIGMLIIVMLLYRIVPPLLSLTGLL